MHEKVHTELTYKFFQDYNKPALDFLLASIAKNDWEWDDKSRVEWLKKWMDMPDSKVHSSKIKNDHSYKIKKVGKIYKIEFAKTGADQATVVARLKYDFRDVTEWKKEHEYRTCGIELAKSIHWIIDFSTPPHTLVGWDDKLHSKFETDCDKNWLNLYNFSISKVKLNRKSFIKDIYLWAKNNIENRYDTNSDLLLLYKNKGSILKDKGVALGQDMMLNLLQNFADYLAYVNKRIDFGKSLKLLNSGAI
jgi:hypothetical protein